MLLLLMLLNWGTKYIVPKTFPPIGAIPQASVTTLKRPSFGRPLQLSMSILGYGSEKGSGQKTTPKASGETAQPSKENDGALLQTRWTMALETGRNSCYNKESNFVTLGR